MYYSTTQSENRLFQLIFSTFVDIFYEESRAEAPIFLTVICYMSCVNEIVQYELFDAVVEGVHTPGVFHFVATFEVFRNAFNLGVMPDKQIVGFLCVPIHIRQILLERSFHTHHIDNGGAMFL